MIPYSSRFKQNKTNKYSCFFFFNHNLSYISSRKPLPSNPLSPRPFSLFSGIKKDLPYDKRPSLL
ncbi:hypothetical protein CHCC20441_0757 [Bacillus licheniformis]|uniref:Uncharacterized protein n=1 Tax=Bacillus licheniformis TaxID=1402 RepID=A0A8B5YHK1_BACLI|nr:hypothetical protein B4090_2599 [Bacillus licheniformis]TWM56144.1 hypothetical protein CHCC14814_2125 [Bacillus paralicheniformis]KYC85997.1 hypothetical protein B4091_2665 [Bacillus licheniformis]KYC97800.1 hypothetical protein B4164_2539 [Bacillus licheniformis]OLF86976.1 hypothetical protein B4094_4394 [Bacillus licheniformis]